MATRPSPNTPAGGLPPVVCTPKKKISLEKLAAIQREITVIDRRIQHVRKIIAENSAVSSDLPTPHSPLTQLFPVYGAGQVSPPSPQRAPSRTLSADNSDDDDTLKFLHTVEMCEAASKGDEATLRILLGSGGDPNCVDYNGRTPLHIAAARGHAGIARILLEHGADLGAVDENGKTAAMIASENGMDQVRDMLTFVNVSAGIEPESFLVSNSNEREGAPLPEDVATPQKEEKIVVIMVGIPGRGKTYVASHIQRFLLWNNYKCTIFTHQSFRKRAANAPDAEARTINLLAHEVCDYLSGGGNVAIVDGTHSTPLRRQHLRQALMDATNLPSNRIVFVEVFSTDEQLIMSNILRAKAATKTTSATFIQDYLANIKEHEQVYRTLSLQTDPDYSFIRMENQTNYRLNLVDGWLQSRLAFMLHNLRHTPQPLYLTRSGEYRDLVSGRIGGNSKLTRRGEAYAKVLYNYMKKELSGTHFEVYSSCAVRCTQTVKHFVQAALRNHEPLPVLPIPSHLPPAPLVTPERSVESMTSSLVDAAALVDATRNHSFASSQGTGDAALQPSTGSATVNCRVAYFPTLDDLNHGDCEGQLISDIMASLPNTMAMMQADRYNIAWPNGESIQQLFTGRLESHIHDIQASTQPLLIVSHEPLIQGFYAYFVQSLDKMIPPEEAHRIPIPLHSVVRIVQQIDRRVAEIIDLEPEVEDMLQQLTEKRQSREELASGEGGGEESGILESPNEGSPTMDPLKWHRGSNVWGE